MARSPTPTHGSARTAPPLPPKKALSSADKKVEREVADVRPRSVGRKPDVFGGRLNVGFLVRDSHRLFRMHLREKLKSEPHILTLWSYLVALFEEDGLSQRELGKRVRLVGPTVVSAINLMERHGLGRRVPSDVDRRVVHVFLTDAGRALEPRIRSIAAELSRYATSDLTRAEVDVLAKLLQRVRQRLDPG